MGEYSSSEVADRISTVKRFRKLLVEQRDRLKDYLEVLDKQKKIITDGNVDDLAAHVELEEKIIADLFALQKSIAPMKAIYDASGNGTASVELPEISATLDSLKTEAARRIIENKELLKSRMGELRSELKNLRANPFARNRRSVFADSGQPTLLDIKG